MNKNKYKIFIGLTEIAGYYTNLQKGFDELGVQNTFINLGKNKFQYKHRIQYSFIVEPIKKANEKYFEYGSKKLKSIIDEIKLQFWKFIHVFLKAVLFLMVIPTHSVFIFGFRRSFFDSKVDLKILKFLKKKIIFVYHGTDSRPPYMNGAFKDQSPREIIEKTRQWKQEIDKIDKYADYVINHPPTSHFHERKIITDFAIGIPYHSDYEPEQDVNTDRIRIIHSPSSPELKGTERIRESISSLKEKYKNIEYIEIINQPNHVVLEHIATCDFVVDQIYSDTHMAGFSTEAAFLGKPAVVGGYYKDYIYDDVPNEYLSPGIFCHPDEIESAIENLIVNKDYRLELGEKLKQFIRNNWNPARVAERYLKLLNNDFPENWYFNPLSLKYPYGWGINKENLKKLIKDVLQDRKENLKFLHLSHNPKLEKILYEISRS